MMNWSWSVVWGWSWSMIWGWSWGWVSNWYNNWMSYNWVSDDWVNSSRVSNYWSMDDGRSMMWLVDSMGDDWSMTMLDSRVAADISGGTSNKGRQCDKGLSKTNK